MGEHAMADAGPQHLKALERANRVRLARAALKRQVAAGERSAAEVIMASPWEAESMSVSELLMSQRRWGRTRCRRILLSLGLPENKQIGTMTERQRTALAAMLSAKVGPARGPAQDGAAKRAPGRADAQPGLTRDATDLPGRSPAGPSRSRRCVRRGRARRST